MALTLAVSLVAHASIATLLVIPRGHAVSLEPPVDPAPAFAGETFELPAPDTASDPLANASPSPDTNAASAPADVGDAPARPVPPAQAKPAPRPSHQGRPSAGHPAPASSDATPGGTGSGGLYGAVGDRSAADLATAFTRAFSQSASADPTWVKAPFGPAGDAVVTITLDDSGHIESTSVTGTPSAALAGSVRGIITLIKGRPFTAKGKVTRLAIHATISPDTVHEGAPSSVFSIAGSFVGVGGSAWFSLAIGRRVDLVVRLR